MKRPRLGALGVGLPVMLLLVLIGWFAGRSGSASGLWKSLQPQVDEKATLAILRSEALAFLVTRRTATQVVVEYDESNLLGEWHGVLWATVTWRWGVDLTKITEKDIRREGQTVVCRLGEPELLDMGIEPGSIHFMSKSTALPKLADIFWESGSQRARLESRLREHAAAFAKEQKLWPTREEMVRQLNDAAGVILQKTGVSLRFE